MYRTKKPIASSPRYLDRNFNDAFHFALRVIGTDIISGRRLPGQRLMTEMDGSEALKVSRTTYREATRTLAALGLVVSRKKTGTVVSPRTSWHMLDKNVVAWTLEFGPTAEFYNSLFELRLALEPAAASLASHRRTEEQYEILSKSLKVLGDPLAALDAYVRAKMIFHETLLEATHNEMFTALIPGVRSAAEWAGKTIQGSRDGVMTTSSNYTHLARAILDGNAEAARNSAAALLMVEKETVSATLKGADLLS